jgi:uncharacterized protein involved in exopolysaccharide biosynthesis
METENKIKLHENDQINLRDIINKYLRNWWLFVISIVFFLVLGYVYIRYQTPRYSATARVLIRDEKSGQSTINQESIFRDLGIFAGEKNIENEIEILKSRSIMSSVVKSLKLNIAYFSFGRPILHERYKDSPITITLLENDTLKYEDYQGSWTLQPISVLIKR